MPCGETLLGRREFDGNFILFHRILVYYPFQRTKAPPWNKISWLSLKKDGGQDTSCPSWWRALSNNAVHSWLVSSGRGEEENKRLRKGKYEKWWKKGGESGEREKKKEFFLKIFFLDAIQYPCMYRSWFCRIAGGKGCLSDRWNWLAYRYHLMLFITVCVQTIRHPWQECVCSGEEWDVGLQQYVLDSV